MAGNTGASTSDNYWSIANFVGQGCSIYGPMRRRIQVQQHSQLQPTEFLQRLDRDPLAPRLPPAAVHQPIVPVRLVASLHPPHLPRRNPADLRVLSGWIERD